MEEDFITRLDAAEEYFGSQGSEDPTVAIQILLFVNLIRRARILLSNRTNNELNAIDAYVNSIIEECGPLIDEAACEIWDRYDNEAPTRYTISNMLRFCVGNYPLEKRSPVKNITWSECFAVHALSTFARFVEDLKEQVADIQNIGDEKISCHMSCLMSYGDAQEAISIAESLDEEARLSAEIGQLFKEKLMVKVREQTKNAAQHKHKNTNLLLKKLIVFYEQGDFKSKKAAVQAFLSSIPEDEYSHLVPTNRERTLYVGLLDVLNGNRKLN
ncbi:MAG: hypothetical protein JAY74_23655 [Candidatus Thiodiazotropha taylori]|nr:hypothetical protein [Candidatus Thiodiazotropha taylori]